VSRQRSSVLRRKVPVTSWTGMVPEAIWTSRRREICVFAGHGIPVLRPSRPQHSYTYDRAAVRPSDQHGSNTWCALRQIHSLFQSQFITERDLVLCLSITRIFSFTSGHPVAAYIFFVAFTSLLKYLHFSHARCNWSPPVFSSTTLENFQFIVPCLYCSSF
jgi:hypothetical protein